MIARTELVILMMARRTTRTEIEFNLILMGIILMGLERVMVKKSMMERERAFRGNSRILRKIFQGI